MPLRADLSTMTSADVARLYTVGLRSVRRWADVGLLPEPTRTGGGHLRWRREDILAQYTAAYVPATAGVRR